MKTELTHDRLKELLDYNPETGVFVRKIGAKGHAAGVASDIPNKAGYLRIGIDRKRYLAHRLAWFYVYGKWPSNHIDHIDHDKLNNKISNLRDVTARLNLQNQIMPHPDNQVGFLGVCFHKKADKFMASIRIYGKQKYLGLFDTAESAHNAYLQAKRIHHEGCTI